MMGLGEVIKKDQRVIDALKKRGITDLTSVRLRRLGALVHRVLGEEGHRIGWGACTTRTASITRGAAQVEGIYILADMTTKKIIDVIDRGRFRCRR